MTDLSIIALEIKDELINDPNISQLYITTWLRDNIGKLNVAIGTFFKVDSQTLNLDSDLSNDQKDLFKSFFYCQYYSNMANKNLGASGFDWVSIEEADSKIRRASKTDVAKVFREMAKDCQQNLQKMIFYYNKNKALPTSSSSFISPMLQFERVSDPQQPIPSTI